MCRRHILSLTPHNVWGHEIHYNKASRRDALLNQIYLDTILDTKGECKLTALARPPYWTYPPPVGVPLSRGDGWRVALYTKLDTTYLILVIREIRGDL